MRFLGFEGEWERKKLGEIAEIVTGSTPPTNDSSFYNGDFLFVSPSDIQTHRHISQTKTTLTEKGFKIGRKIRSGSSLFVCIGSTIGKVGQVKKECVTNQQINSVISDDNNDDNFIFSLLEHNSLKIKELSAEQAVPIINKTTFSNFKIIIPNLPEQTKIALFLLHIDKRITTQMKIIEELEKIRFGLRFQIFKQLKNDNVEVKPIKDLINYEQPTKYLVIDENYSQNPLLTPVLTANKAFVLGYTDENFGIYNKGNCIIFDDFTMDMKYVTFSFKVKSSAIKILKPKSDINLRYVFEYLLSLNLQSGEHKRHYISEIEFKKVPLLAKEYQNSIASLFSSIDNKIIVEKSLLSAYQQQKKYLLQNLFI